MIICYCFRVNNILTNSSQSNLLFGCLCTLFACTFTDYCFWRKLTNVQTAHTVFIIIHFHIRNGFVWTRPYSIYTFQSYSNRIENWGWLMLLHWITSPTYFYLHMLKLIGEQKHLCLVVSKGRRKWNESQFSLAANGKSKLIIFSFQWTTFPITQPPLFIIQFSFADKWVSRSRCESQVRKKDSSFVDNLARFEVKSIRVMDGKMQMNEIRLLKTILQLVQRVEVLSFLLKWFSICFI